MEKLVASAWRRGFQYRQHGVDAQAAQAVRQRPRVAPPPAHRRMLHSASVAMNQQGKGKKPKGLYDGTLLLPATKFPMRANAAMRDTKVSH